MEPNLEPAVKIPTVLARLFLISTLIGTDPAWLVISGQTGSYDIVGPVALAIPAKVVSTNVEIVFKCATSQSF